MTIKVNVDQEGEATTNGLPAFATVMAPADAPLVRYLRRAGAIIVGRTNTPEVSMRATTVNPLHGRTISPWHPEATPGGSSGGAGVAAAVGFGPIHHGNDIGGSLRFPAFANGVVTLKPTPGRVPAFNPSATAERGIAAQLMSVQGTIARTVDDVRLGRRVMAQDDARGLQQAKDLFDAAIYSYGINYLGLPAGVVPIDLVEDLPAGVQLVGRRFREDVILDAMAAIEQRAGRLVDRLWRQI